jgi:hypothetical protein
MAVIYGLLKKQREHDWKHLEYKETSMELGCNWESSSWANKYATGERVGRKS